MSWLCWLGSEAGWWGLRGWGGEMSEKAALALETLSHTQSRRLQMAEDNALGGSSKHILSHQLGQTWDLKALFEP